MAWIAVLAGVAFGLALALLAASLVTHDQRLERASGLCFGAFAALATPTIFEIAGRPEDAGLAGTFGAIIGVASVGVIGIGQTSAAVNVVTFRRIAPLLALALLGFLAWVGLTSVQIAMSGGLPANLGWLGIITTVLGVVVVGGLLRQPAVLRGHRQPGRGQLAGLIVSLAGVVAWMVWLGVSL